jgi:hypothetical protein
MNEVGLKLWEFGSHLAINSIVEFEVRMIMLPAYVDSIIDCFGIERKGLPYNKVVFKLDFDYSSVFHKYMEDEQIYKTIGNEEYANLLIHIPPMPKGHGLPVANSL